MTKIVRSVQPLSNNCYVALFELRDRSINYFTSVTDYVGTIVRIVHTLGKIYDNIEELVLSFDGRK